MLPKDFHLGRVFPVKREAVTAESSALGGPGRWGEAWGRLCRPWCWAVPRTHPLTRGLHLGCCPGRGVRGGWDIWAWPGLGRTEVADGLLRDEVARLSDLSRATRGNRAGAGTRLCWPGSQGGQGSCPHSSLLDSHRPHLDFSGMFSCGVLFCLNPHRSPREPQGKQRLP